MISLGLYKIIEKPSIGHNVMHGSQTSSGPGVRLQDLRLGPFMPRSWKHSKHRHPRPHNVIGKDEDFGYAISPLHQVPWQPHHLIGPLTSIGAALGSTTGSRFSTRARRNTDDARLAKAKEHCARRGATGRAGRQGPEQYGKSTSSPPRWGPFAAQGLPATLAKVIATCDVTIIHCGT